ncbi:MAG: hypothetical protein R2681_06785 [Pyrinomonadaceae bacterium]
MFLKTRLGLLTIIGIVLLFPSLSFAQKNLAEALPDVDGWKKGEVVKYATEELGYSVGYQSAEGGTVTIYFYHGGVKNIPDGADNRIVKAELEKAESDIIAYGEMGYYQNVKKMSSGIDMLGLENGIVETQHANFDIEVRGVKMTSDIYLFGKDKYFVKFRASRRKGDGITPNKVFADFMAKMDEYFSE